MFRLIKNYWNVLRRPSMHLSLGFLVIGSFVAGVVFWGGFNTAMEATNTETIVRMVEGGLGISIVPLLESGVVTRGRKVGVHSLGTRIREIHSGVLTRRGERLAGASGRFLDFVRRWGKPE